LKFQKTSDIALTSVKLQNNGIIFIPQVLSFVSEYPSREYLSELIFEKQYK